MQDEISFVISIRSISIVYLLMQDNEILDRDVRPFAEECDSLQGFQMILDSHTSWAGFGVEYIDALREEFPKASIWTWGIETNAVSSFLFKLRKD
jgi:hypothetical protein